MSELYEQAKAYRKKAESQIAFLESQQVEDVRIPIAISDIKQDIVDYLNGIVDRLKVEQTPNALYYHMKNQYIHQMNDMVLPYKYTSDSDQPVGMKSNKVHLLHDLGLSDGAIGAFDSIYRLLNDEGVYTHQFTMQERFMVDSLKKKDLIWGKFGQLTLSPSASMYLIPIHHEILDEYGWEER